MTTKKRFSWVLHLVVRLISVRKNPCVCQMTHPDRDTQLSRSSTYRFLERYRVQGRAAHNLLSLAGGKWHVPDTAYESFLEHYHSEHSQFYFAFVEVKSTVFPFFLDIDKTDQYTDPPALVQQLLQCLQQEVWPRYNIEAGEVLFSHRPNGGWHLICPEVMVTKPQGLQIRDKLVSALKSHNASMDWDGIVDASVMKGSGLRMLGSFKYTSRKESGMCVPQLGVYLPQEAVPDGFKTTPITIKLLKRSSIHSLGECQPTSEIKLELERDLDKDCSNLHQTPTSFVDGHCLNVPSKPSLALVQNLLQCLNARRADQYIEWQNVCYALVDCVTEAAAIPLLAMYHSWSKQSEKYDSGSVEQMWHHALQRKESYGKPKITVASLFAWAKQDNIRKYLLAMSNGKDSAMEDKLTECLATRGDFVFAEVFQLMLGHIYRCSDSRHRSYYRFSGHKWRDCPEGELSVVLSRQVRQAFLDMAEQTTKTHAGEESKKAAEAWQECANTLLRTGPKASILCELRNLLYDDAFYQDLDSNMNLLGFENGLFDLDSDTFREGRPEDLVSFSVGYDYALSDDAGIQGEIMAFINSCFCDPQTAEHLLDVTASCLHGYRRFEKFYIQKGRGRNGKGAIAELIKHAFGDYFAVIDMAFFTQPRKSSSAASPELADKKGKRYLLSTEPEASEKIQISKLKHLTGGDTISARPLYCPPVYFKPQFGIFFQTNDMPDLSKIDGGAEKRVEVFEFPFVFTDAPTQPHHKLLDPSLKEKKVVSLVWRQQFMRMLIHRFNTRIKHAKALVPPKTVMQETQSYLDGCNPVKAWLEEHCNVTGNPASRIKPTDLFNKYKCSTDAPMGSKSFYQALDYNGISQIKSGRLYYVGLAFKEDQSDEVIP